MLAAGASQRNNIQWSRDRFALYCRHYRHYRSSAFSAIRCLISAAGSSTVGLRLSDLSHMQATGTR